MFIFNKKALFCKKYLGSIRKHVKVRQLIAFRWLTVSFRLWAFEFSRNISPKLKTKRVGGQYPLEILHCQDFSRDQERWRRNRTGRPLSPSQSPQKNISTPSKLHKTTSVGWQRTSGNQKSRPLSSKTGRKKYKRQKRRQKRWGGSSVPGREARPGKGILRREISKHQETLSLPSLWRALETQRAT